MNIVDTHSHLFVEEFISDCDSVISRAKEAGVSRVYMPNINLASLPSLLDTCKRYCDYCFPMIGLHPTDIHPDYIDELMQLKSYLKQNHPFKAVGEIGLDFYWETQHKEEQIDVFKRQIEWALEFHLPVVIHSRKAYQELISVLEDYRKHPLCGIFHCFDGSLEEAQTLLEFEGFMLGIGGVITYKNSQLPNVVKQLPLQRLVVETDSPYLPPVPYRGKRNESAYIVEVVKKVASLYGCSEEEVAEVTAANAYKIFEHTNR